MVKKLKKIIFYHFETTSLFCPCPYLIPMVDLWKEEKKRKKRKKRREEEKKEKKRKERKKGRRISVRVTFD